MTATEPQKSPRQIAPCDDLFTAEEACAFLKLENPYTLRTLRERHGLKGQRFGKKFLYHRQHLVALAERMFGVNQPSPAGSRSKR